VPWLRNSFSKYRQPGVLDFGVAPCNEFSHLAGQLGRLGWLVDDANGPALANDILAITIRRKYAVSSIAPKT
jgi:hypothetical protein